LLKPLVVQGVGGHDSASVATARGLIASRRDARDALRMHALPLADTERAIPLVGRRIAAEAPIHVTLLPTGRPGAPP
jgi:hypothetical protein